MPANITLQAHMVHQPALVFSRISPLPAAPVTPTGKYSTNKLNTMRINMGRLRYQGITIWFGAFSLGCFILSSGVLAQYTTTPGASYHPNSPLFPRQRPARIRLLGISALQFPFGFLPGNHIFPTSWSLALQHGGARAYHGVFGFQH